MTIVRVAHRWRTVVKGVPTCRANIVMADNHFHFRTVGVISFSDEIARGGFGRRRPLCPADWTTPCAMVTSAPALLAAMKIGRYADSALVLVSPGLPRRPSGAGNGLLGKTCDVLAADGPTVVRGVLREGDTE